VESEAKMNYQEWLTTVPVEITQDPLWKLEIYRLGLFAADIGLYITMSESETGILQSPIPGP
jgi:hypothetical protein